MKPRYYRGHNISLMWLFVLSIIEIVLIWAVASQFKYAVMIYGDLSAFYVFLVLGIIVVAILAGLTLGMAGVYSTHRWDDERCTQFLGLDCRMMYKNEMMVLSAIVLGTLIGTGVWDMITTINALYQNGWDLNTFNDPYVVIDFIWFEIVWVLWVHTLVGTVKGGIALVIAIMVGSQIKHGKFCEV